jgi:hypothetical protein
VRQSLGWNPTPRSRFLESLNLAAWARAMNMDRMYVNRRKAINILFTLYTLAKTAEEKALLDSGATHNFMDKRMVK